MRLCNGIAGAAVARFLAAAASFGPFAGRVAAATSVI
jgi:hypothetical protein